MFFLLVVLQTAFWHLCLSQSYQGGNAVTSSPVTAVSNASPSTGSPGPVSTATQSSSSPTQSSAAPPSTTTSTITSTTSSTSTSPSPISSTSFIPGLTPGASLTSATPLASCGTAGTICITLDGNSCFSQNEASCNTLGKISNNDADTISVDITARNANLVNTWAGVGFSASGGMAAAIVVTCIVPDNGTAFGKLTYNNARANTNTGWANIDQSPLTFTATALSNGVLHCTGILRKVFPIPDNAGQIASPFDVRTVQLAVIMATGPFTSGILQNHGTSRTVFGIAQFP